MAYTYTKILTPTDVSRDAVIPQAMYHNILQPHLPQHEDPVLVGEPTFLDIQAYDTQRRTPYPLVFRTRLTIANQLFYELLRAGWSVFVRARTLQVGAGVKFSWNANHNRLEMRVVDNWNPIGRLRSVRVPAQQRPFYGWGLPRVDGTLPGALILVFMRNEEAPQQQQQQHEQQRNHRIQGRLYLVRLENGEVSYNDLGNDASLVEIHSWTDDSNSSGVFVEKYNGEAGMLLPMLQEFLKPESVDVFSRKCNVSRDVIGLDGIAVVGRFHEHISSSIMEYLRSNIAEDFVEAGSFGKEASLGSDGSGSSSSSSSSSSSR